MRREEEETKKRKNGESEKFEMTKYLVRVSVVYQKLWNVDERRKEARREKNKAKTEKASPTAKAVVKIVTALASR